MLEHVISSGDQWAEYLKGVPTCEKRIVLHGYLKQDLTVHKQGNHAPMLSPKQEALDGTPEEDIPNGAFSAPHFGIHISIAEATGEPSKQRHFNRDVTGLFQVPVPQVDKHKPSLSWSAYWECGAWGQCQCVCCVYSHMEGKVGRLPELPGAL